MQRAARTQYASQRQQRLPPVTHPFRVALPHPLVIPRAYQNVPRARAVRAIHIQQHPLSYTPQQRLNMFGFAGGGLLGLQAHQQRRYAAAVARAQAAQRAYALAHQPVHRGFFGSIAHDVGGVANVLGTPLEEAVALSQGRYHDALSLQHRNDATARAVARPIGHGLGQLYQISPAPAALSAFRHPSEFVGGDQARVRAQQRRSWAATRGLGEFAAPAPVKALEGKHVTAMDYLNTALLAGAGPLRVGGAVGEGLLAGGRATLAARATLAERAARAGIELPAGARGLERSVPLYQHVSEAARFGAGTGARSYVGNTGLIRPVARALHGLTPSQRTLRASFGLKDLYRQLENAPNLTRTDVQVYKKWFAESLKAMKGRGTAANLREAVSRLAAHDPKLAEAMASGPAPIVHIPGEAAPVEAPAIHIPGQRAPGEAVPAIHVAADEPVPGQEFAHLTDEQLQTQMEKINSDYEHIVSELAKGEGVPGDFKRLTAYQNARAKKLGRRGQKYPTVKEMMRSNAEANFQKFLDDHPNDPYVQRIEEDQRQAYRMQQELYRRTDPLFQIDPFHEFPGERTNTHLKSKLNPRYKKSGLPARKAVVGKNGLHFSGTITPEAWVKRVLHHFSSPEEIDQAARWYQHFEPIFRREFPPDVVDKIIRAFSVSQANASPSGGLASSLVAMERISKGEDVGSIGSVVADNIEKALRGEPLDSHIAAKLSDFIDALRGSPTRTWMGHAAEGGAPAPIDIWGLRDLGYIDSKIGSKGRDKRLLDLHGVNVKRLKVNNPGSASGARYERAAEKYHEITDHLNEIGFNGRRDWTPAETQALGWSAIQRHYGQVPEDLETAVLKARPRAKGIFKRSEMKRHAEMGHFPSTDAEARRIENRPTKLFQSEHPLGHQVEVSGWTKYGDYETWTGEGHTFDAAVEDAKTHAPDGGIIEVGDVTHLSDRHPLPPRLLQEPGFTPPPSSKEEVAARAVGRSSAPKGAFIQEGDKGAIYMLPSADVSTAAHEWAHFMRAFGIKDSHEEQRLAEHFGATELPDGNYHWSTEAEENFARGYEAWIHSGDAPRNLVLEFKHLQAQFRSLYPAGKLPEVPEDIQAIFKSMAGHENGSQILHWLLRNSRVAGRAISPDFVPRGGPRTPEEATAHALEANARRQYRGFGQKVKDIPRLKQGELSDETGRVLGQRVREHMAGFTDTSGMSPFGHEAMVAKQELRPQDEIRKEQLAGYSTVRGQRSAAGDVAFEEAGGGLAGHYARKGELKGELPKVGTKNLDLTSAEHDHLVNFIEHHPALDFTEKGYTRTRANDALLKLTEGKSLQRNESLLLESIFGRMESPGSLKKAWQQMGWWDKVVNTAGVPRSMMAMGDQSAPFRHGIMGLAAMPKEWLDQWIPMYKAMYKDSNFEESQAIIDESPYRALMAGGDGRTGIAMTEPGVKLETREENFPSAMAELIPGIGKLIHISDKGYVNFLNGLRAAMAEHYYQFAAEQGWDLNDDHLISSINRFVNSATGRGDLGAFQKYATTLNATLFSPRLLWSRINFLNPVFYARLHPFARRQALKSLSKLMAGAAFTMGMARLAGAQVSFDPRNSDFGKIKVGNTRIDFLGGFQQPLVLLSRLATMTSVSPTTGRPMSLSGKGFGTSELDILQRFFANKLAPVPSAMYEAFSQKDPLSGQPVGRGSFVPDIHHLFGPEGSLEKNFVLKRMIPLLAQDIASLPPGPESGLGVLPAMGIGASSYGPPLTGQKLIDAINKATRDAGVGKPPAIVLEQAKLKGELADATYAGQSSRDKMLAAAKVFDKIHGTGMEKTLSGIQMTNARAETEYQNLAHRIAPLYDSWLSRINARLAKMKAAEPAGGPSPPAVQKSGAAAPAPHLASVDTSDQAAYHVPAGNVRSMASHGVDAASHTQGLPPELGHAIDSAAAKFHVPAKTLAGIWAIESGRTFPNPAVNSSGYGGLFGTTQWKASTQHQADYAALTLRHLLDTHGGNMAAALHAYSGGGYTAVPGAAGGPVHVGVGGGGGGGAPMSPGGAQFASTATGGFGGAGGGPNLDTAAEAILQDLARGSYNPSEFASKAFDALSTTPISGNVQGINFVMPKGGKAAPAARGAIALAEHYLGTPYVWGGESPKGFDCSGLLQFIYGKQGIRIPRTSQQQYQAGRRVGRGQLRPGDAVFFVGSDGTRSAPGHEGIYIGGGRFIEAPHTGTTVRISNLRGMRDYVGARRFTR